MKTPRGIAASAGLSLYSSAYSAFELLALQSAFPEHLNTRIPEHLNLDFHNHGNHDGAAAGALAQIFGYDIVDGDANGVHVRTFRIVEFFHRLTDFFAGRLKDFVAVFGLEKAAR